MEKRQKRGLIDIGKIYMLGVHRTQRLFSAVLLLLAVICSFAVSLAIDVTLAYAQESALREEILKKAGKFITALACDGKGGIWIGTEDNGVWFYDVTNSNYPRAKQFTTRDGLGDNNAYAVACDKLCRVWVGHLNHGVSVYNGKRWRNYGVLDGPLGERVFAMATSPKDGDVWIATSAGFCRYSLERHMWLYYTRAHGLPSDQIQALAFDKYGTLYAGTQCDGLVIGRVAGSRVTWRHIRGPDRMPLKARGTGLPSSQINDVLVAKDGRIYVATNFGLAIGSRGGMSWKYIRGKDLSDKLRMRYSSKRSAKASQTSRAVSRLKKKEGKMLLQEDYVTCLAEDERGLIWIGHRIKGYEVLDPESGKIIHIMEEDGNRFVSRITPVKGQAPILGRYGGGVTQATWTAPSVLKKRVSPKISATAAGGSGVLPKLPAPVRPPSAEELQMMLAKVSSLTWSLRRGNATYLGEDWITQGDWVGRYGRHYTVLCATESPFDNIVAFPYMWDFYKVEQQIGPNRRKGDSLRYWIHWLKTKNKKTLYNPCIGYRRQAEWDDHGEAYPITFEGPDLWITIEIPLGVHKISFYFFNKDGHSGRNRYRDYLLEFRPYTEKLSEAHFSSAIARTRIRDFWGGVYKTFLVKGPAKYLACVRDNYSFNTIVSSVMIDQMTGKPSPRGEELWGMADVRYTPPKWDISESQSKKVERARMVWRALNEAWDKHKNWLVQRQFRIFAYRLAVKENASGKVLGNWRWELKLWTKQDRQEFRKKMNDAWKWFVDNNPHIFKSAAIMREAGLYADLPFPQ